MHQLFKHLTTLRLLIVLVHCQSVTGQKIVRLWLRAGWRWPETIRTFLLWVGSTHGWIEVPWKNLDDLSAPGWMVVASEILIWDVLAVVRLRVGWKWLERFRTFVAWRFPPSSCSTRTNAPLPSAWRGSRKMKTHAGSVL